MYVLALTGGIGSGKSTAARVFAERGAVIIDLDDVAKTILDEVPSVREAMVAEFGPAILGENGRIDRGKLAEIGFASEEATRRMNSVSHPAVLAAVAGALDTLVLQAVPPAVVVLVIPLLAESPLFLEPIDAVLAISAHEDVRLDRAVARGMSREDAERRCARQAGDAERREIADYVIDNDGTLDEFREALVEFWDTEIAPREG